MAESFGEEKEIAMELTWFCVICSCCFKHLSGMRKVLKVRDISKEGVLKVFFFSFFFFTLNTPTGTLVIFARKYLLLSAVTFEKVMLFRDWSSYIPIT